LTSFSSGVTSFRRFSGLMSVAIRLLYISWGVQMSKLVKTEEIKNMIVELRGQKVMLDKDLALLYGVSTGALNQAVKRNRYRFPKDFIFQLNDYEVKLMVSQNVIPHKKYFGGRNPYAFTRNGANMLSAVLKSSNAIRRSIQIMRAFSALEEIMGNKRKVLAKSPEIMKKLSLHSKAIMQLFQKDKIKEDEIEKIRVILGEMINLLQQMVIQSLGVA